MLENFFRTNFSRESIRKWLLFSAFSQIALGIFTGIVSGFVAVMTLDLITTASLILSTFILIGMGLFFVIVADSIRPIWTDTEESNTEE